MNETERLSGPIEKLFEPSAETIEKMVAWSFFHSQGHNGLQSQILRYIGMKIAHAKGKLPHKQAITARGIRAEAESALGVHATRPLVPRKGSQVLGHRKVSLNWDVYSQYTDDLYEGYKDGLKNSKAETIPLMAQVCLDRDIAHFDKRTQIARLQSKKGHLGPHREPSFVLAYAFNNVPLLERDIAPEVEPYFRIMYADIRQYLESQVEQDNLLYIETFQKLQRKFEEYRSQAGH